MARERPESVEGSKGWKIRRYYSGVRKLRTTICCSVVALTIVRLASLIAQMPPLPSPKSPAPPALPPFQIAWTVALNGSLTAPPVFSGRRGYFPLDEGRLAAHDL